jgi:protein-tyrosine phosphatase
MPDTQAGNDRPSLAVSLLWLVGLGVFFYSSYGFSNWLAGTRAHVPSIVFAWESGVPFLSWTIVPYWTTNLLYAASLFLCRTRAEFFSHVRRLLTVQVVCVVCFILLPLKFSRPQPDTAGTFHLFYAALRSFDRPYNQAPSLHVALTIVLGAVYLRILPRWARVAYIAWSALIVLSVMTTYQHHFIDIPTGILLGLFCVWLFPSEGHRRISSWQMARDRRLTLALGYGAVAILSALIASSLRGVFLWLLWPAFALFSVALAYLWLGVSVFDKTPEGTIGWPSRLLLLPYLVMARFNSRLWTQGEAKTVEIVEGVHLGRFPARQDVAGFATVIDLTSELSKPAVPTRWICYPMLDLAAPHPALLASAADAVERARVQGPVLVVCALGYGRSVATLAAWLVRTGRASDVDSALAQLRSRRPKLLVSTEQIQSIHEAVVHVPNTRDQATSA